ncbi:MAG: aminotransferase class I/II-fold pyridoxal phosphate-dependent enzyme [Planctomycetes bacterium]|nr:aminotransferase class I/II-fold pyridoxal phosphate-dependent enzyme [Planctomycetota bacterium]
MVRLSQKLAEIAGTRRLVYEGLEAITDFCRTPPAMGAFYLLLQLDLAIEPMELVRRLVCEHRVAAIPGSAFGVDDNCSLRIAFGAIRRDDVAEAMGRLVRGLRSIHDEVGSGPTLLPGR